MRFVFDANLSPHLADAIAALSKPLDVEVTHLRHRFPEGTPDIEWIDALAGEKDWNVVSHDRFHKNPLEKEALRRAGLTVFALTKSWANQKFWEKASRLVLWWPRILEQADLVSGSAVFEVPWKFSGKGRFKQIPL